MKRFLSFLLVFFYTKADVLCPPGDVGIKGICVNRQHEKVKKNEPGHVRQGPGGQVIQKIIP